MQLEILWKLQEIDLSNDALSRELENVPLLQEVDDMKEKLAQLKTEQAGEEERLKVQRKRLKSLEMDLQNVLSSIAELRKKLYGGEVSNVRELENMEMKLNSLEKRQELLEEETLAEMETTEELESARQELDRRVENLAKELGEKEQELALTLARIREDLDELREKRAVLAGQVEPRHLERYTILRKKQNGRALARVIDDICEGCRVFISSAQRGFLYNPNSLVYCESCGRLLVKLEEHEKAVEE